MPANQAAYAIKPERQLHFPNRLDSREFFNCADWSCLSTSACQLLLVMHAERACACCLINMCGTFEILCFLSAFHVFMILKATDSAISVYAGSSRGQCNSSYTGLCTQGTADN